jgi:hypothetical protein
MLSNAVLGGKPIVASQLQFTASCSRSASSAAGMGLRLCSSRSSTAAHTNTAEWVLLVNLPGNAVDLQIYHISDALYIMCEVQGLTAAEGV